MSDFLTRLIGARSSRTRIRPAAPRPRRAALGVVPLEDRSVPSTVADAMFRESTFGSELMLPAAVNGGASLQVHGAITVNESVSLHGFNDHSTGALRNVSGNNTWEGTSLNGLAAGTYVAHVASGAAGAGAGKVAMQDVHFVAMSSAGAFDQAAARWEQIIVGDVPNATEAGTLIPVKVKHNI